MVVRQLQLVFFISTVLLLISFTASFYSIQRLISNSRIVAHTSQVLLEAENIISLMKDAETGHRGYLLTHNPVFLQPYTGSYGKVNASYTRLQELSVNNPAQQRNLLRVQSLYEAKFAQMQQLMDRFNQNPAVAPQQQALQKGKQLMDSLRQVINQIKSDESSLLQSRLQQQQFYVAYTPLLLIIATLISMFITGFAYVRIKKEMDVRMAQQEREDVNYALTNRRIAEIEALTHAIAGGDYAVRSPEVQDDELGRIARALNQMAGALEDTFADLKNKNWLQTGAVSLRDAIRGEKDVKQLAERLLTIFTNYLNAPLGTVYLMDIEGNFRLTGSYAAKQAPLTIHTGEGLTGQAIADKKMIVVQDVPVNYSSVTSSLGHTLPNTLLIVPLVYDNQCVGIIELGLLRKPSPLEVDFVEMNREAIAIGVNTALDFIRLQNFLEETQVQAEELQAQHKELESLNAELEMQTQKLQASEEELRVQQEELQQTNIELEERSVLLEEKNSDIQKKAAELEIATRYKSEFLANMSHELRTPLNSILLLSRLLAENTDKNLNRDQVEYAQVIQSSGNGLLGLIDEILDLSKIEAGQMQLDSEDVAIRGITDELRGLFGVLAKEKGLDFSIAVEPEVPSVIETDRVRLGQILKNLISNALKFTAAGSVSLTIRRPPDMANTLSFLVKDTGIGIPPEKQRLVFEAFQQADGSTKRKYGGTGLGLSISRELAKLLGGEITLESRVNEGSTFTVHLPIFANRPVPSSALLPQPPTPELALPPAGTSRISNFISATIPENISDDRDILTDQDRVILIIEDDTNFARSLLEYARQNGYKGIVAVRGDEGLKLASQFKPMGILLDVQLPVMSGWEVMESLKANPQTRPIPVHIMSSHKLKNESLLKGAIDFVDKPVAFEQMPEVFEKIERALNRDSRKVLIIEDNPKHAKALAYFLSSFKINSELRSNIAEGIEALKEVDCVILDMGIPNSRAYETLEEARQNPALEKLPIIIFTGKNLSMAEELKIKKYADTIVVKTVHSYQRMLDEVSLFLHLVEDNKQRAGTGPAKKLLGLAQVLNNKTVLVADDDVRNIFSLSKALEQYNMTVIAALDGQEAIQKLTENPTIDAVMLDMMMPRMDGYETARKIREQPQWKQLPVIAVTAKAMTGDREKCIQAGASDYITKPVDIDQLISLLRVWLYDRS